VTVETEIVEAVVAMDINVHVALDKSIVTRSGFAAGFAETLGFGADLSRALDDMSIEMANRAVAWTVDDGGPRCGQRRPGRGKRRARPHAAARSTATAFGAKHGKSE
jgi:hypothetical protein